jgi:hypothetical protein
MNTQITSTNLLLDFKYRIFTDSYFIFAGKTKNQFI